jgi:hypothetical protein
MRWDVCYWPDSKWSQTDQSPWWHQISNNGSLFTIDVIAERYIYIYIYIYIYVKKTSFLVCLRRQNSILGVITTLFSQLVRTTLPRIDSPNYLINFLFEGWVYKYNSCPDCKHLTGYKYLVIHPDKVAIDNPSNYLHSVDLQPWFLLCWSQMCQSALMSSVLWAHNIFPFLSGDAIIVISSLKQTPFSGRPTHYLLLLGGHDWPDRNHVSPQAQ